MQDNFEKGEKTMKKKILITIVILFVLMIAGVIWYKMPVDFVDVSSDEVLEIVIFNGSSGEELHITERDEVEHIIESLNTVKMQRRGVSSFHKGYSFRTTIYLTNGEEADGWNNFIINANDTIRKDPFFYEVIEGNTDYDYIQGLFRAE